MTTKLKIIGPYTPEHPGPFCTRDGRPVRILCTDMKVLGGDDCAVVALVDLGEKEVHRTYSPLGKYAIKDHPDDLMNSEEIPVAREFWINEYEGYGVSGAFRSELHANESGISHPNYIRTIHVREVLPGDGE